MLVRSLSVLLLALGLGSAHGAEPLAEVVVSMRYPQQTGISHAHLYLYRADGRLLRQLTNDHRGQDYDPIFNADGSAILFTRELPDNVKQCWSIDPGGRNLQIVPTPDWYSQTKSSPSYGHIFNGPPIVREPRPAPTDPRSITTPDGQTTIELVPLADTLDFGAPDRWGVQLRKTDGGLPTKIGTLEGYSAGFLSQAGDDRNECVLHDENLDVAFCFVHLDSTAGNSVSALDLRSKHLTRLSPNMATPYPLPGDAAFLTLTENRYRPYGDGEHTANCFYVERWDSKWKAIRYAKGKMPGVCYGASMYRPGRTPATITIRSDTY